MKKIDLKKSPTYWEDLLKMPAGDLRGAFDAAAALSLGWAVDQARCLSLHVERASPQAAVIREFCAVAAPVALRGGDLDTALQAYHLAANDPALNGNRSAAAMKIRELLDGMLRENAQRALGTAILLKARTNNNPEIAAQVLDFLVAAAGEDCHPILMNVVRTGADHMTVATMDRLLARMQNLATIRPYQAFDIAREIVLQDCRLTQGQGALLLALKGDLENDTNVQLSILEKEFGEDIVPLNRLRNLSPARFQPEKPSLN